MSRKVACAISGGVDSLVSALLLKKRGFEVTGVFMINWDHVEEGNSNCPRTRDQADAEFVCRQLDIKLHVVNFVKEYWNMVFTDLINGYQQGQTLVPDIECNRVIKFGLLHDYVRNQLKIDNIATGHYAQNSWGNYLERVSEEKSPLLCTARDTYKDQTYFLSTLNADQLKRSMFPVGGLLKPEVKKIAEENGFSELSKKQEHGDFTFRKSRGQSSEVHSGKLIGEHKGTHNYTLGKRIIVDQQLFPNHEGMFVTRCDSVNNTIYVCEGPYNQLLYAKKIKLGPIHWISNAPSEKTLQLSFRCQRTHPVVECQLEIINESETILKSSLPIRAAAPGQTCVFYQKNVCLGSSRIIDVLETL
ncbi:TRNA-5-taurinomethyluridine 2-sulfurtransferase [Aphelenchoides bicaudatus]|nr:TRNA-5-taurinomethyluridine 2-sulfurtransferase [Aphelenchoides bicaudatus]